MADIRVEIQLEDKSFTSGTVRAGQSLKNFREELARTNRHFADLQAAGQGGFRSLRRVEEGSRTALGTMRDLSIVAHGVSLAFNALSGASSGMLGNIIRVNSEMEKLRYQMAGMSSAADPMADANYQVKQLQELATQTPFAIGALSNAFVKMKTAGLDPAGGSLKSLTDGLAAFGASDDQLNRVVLGITQMSGKGVIQMEELRQQLGESMPTAMKLMARSMGVSIADLTKAISTGRVEAGAALSKWFAEVDRSYGGTGEMMMKTFAGQMSKIKTELVKLVDEGEIGAAFEKLKGMMGDFSEALASEDARRFFDQVGLGLQTALGAMEQFAKFLWSYRDEFVMMSKVAIASFAAIAASGAIKGVSRVFAAMKVDIIGIGLAAKATATNVITSMSNMVASLRAAQGSGGIAAALGFGGVGQALGTARVGLGGLIGGFGTLISFGGRLLGVLGPIGLAIGTFGPLLWDGAKALWDMAFASEKVKDEIKSAERAALDQKQSDLDAQKAALEAEVRRSRYEAEESAFRRVNAPQRKQDYRVALERYETFLNEYNKMNADYAVERTDLDDKERRERAEHQRKLIEQEFKASTDDIRKDYRNSQDSSYEQLMADTRTAREEGRSGRKEMEEYHQRSREIEGARLKALIETTDKQIEAAQKAVESGDAEKEVLEDLYERRKKLDSELAATGDKEYRVDLLLETENEEKKFARLERTFDSARDRVKGLSAELNGASGDVAKLFFQIKRGDFGRIDEGVDHVDALRQALIESTVAAEALDKILKNTSAAESEIKRVYENLQEENLKAMAALEGVDLEGPFADLDFFNWKRAKGLLEGIGQTPADTVRMALDSVTKGVDTSMVKFRSLGETIKQDAFGNDTILRINTVGQALQGIRDITTGISGDMSNLAIPGSMFAGGSPLIRSNVDGGILDLIATRESGKDYNATLDNGRWTGGAQNLVGMTLNQVRDLQRSMLADPANRAKYGNGKGSSALGRYQIVGQTLQGLMKEMSLSGDELFDEKMQDAMAARLLGRRGRDASGLRLEWEGLNGVSDADIYAAWDRSMNGPTIARANSAIDKPSTSELQLPYVSGDVQNEMMEGASSAHDRIDALQKSANDLAPEVRANSENAALLKQVRDLQAELDAMGWQADLDKYGTKEQSVREAIILGKFGDVKDPDDGRYEAAIEAARKIDEANEKIKKNKEAQTEIDRAQEKLIEQRVEMEERIKTAREQTKDPNYKGMSADMQKLAQAEKDYLEAVQTRYGMGSEEYKSAVAEMAKQRTLLTQAEGSEALRDLTKEADESVRAGMSDRARRKAEFDERVRELDALKQQAIRNGMDVAEAEKQFNRAVAAERLQLLKDQNSALGASLEQMGKLGENINASTADWAQSLSDNIYDVISGETNSFSAVGDAVRESIARSLSDKASSLLLKPFETMLGGDGSPNSGLGGLIERALGLQDNGASIMAGLTGVLKKVFSGIGSFLSNMFSKSGMVPVKHSGGVVGQGGGWGRSAPMASFIGAPKFHTGGIIGGSKLNLRKGLNPSEVPIIAQKGEGVFTPEQMAHLGGTMNNQSVTINAPITVHGSAGTPEQNNDLAKQVARESEGMMRGIIRDEMSRQLRPGGILRG